MPSSMPFTKCWKTAPNCTGSITKPFAIKNSAVRIAKANPAQPDCKKQVAQFQVTDRYMGTKKKIGFAVVGLGSIAKSSVLSASAHCKNARLVALVRRDEKNG